MIPISPFSFLDFGVQCFLRSGHYTGRPETRGGWNKIILILYSSILSVLQTTCEVRCIHYHSCKSQTGSACQWCWSAEWVSSPSCLDQIHGQTHKPRTWNYATLLYSQYTLSRSHSQCFNIEISEWARRWGLDLFGWLLPAPWTSWGSERERGRCLGAETEACLQIRLC